ncbi:MAG: DUF4962 domain-containing protein [Kiritimatiellaeota bacterium]|nr:DUF4962 domain-containing protein [Kiritimatiellota bacterium]
MFHNRASLPLLTCLLCSAAAGLEPFEASPAPAQTVPRPYNGETVAVNPPCFVFPAVRRFPAYVVEFSRSAEFAPEATHRLTGKWMLNCPEGPLESGRWFWRWRPLRPGGDTQWSAVRAFTVPEDVPVLPFPDVPTLVRRLGRSHPRVNVTADGLIAFRRQAAARFGPHWPTQIRHMTEAAARKNLLPEPDSLPDAKREGRLRRVEVYQKTFMRYRPYFAEMTRLAEAYLLIGNEKAGVEAKRRLLSIVAWDPAGSTKLRHNDEVGTEVVRHCPRVFDWIYPLLTPDERRKCLDVFRVRMQEMFDTLLSYPFEKKPYSSHVMGYYLPDLLQACLAVSGDLDVTEMLHYTLLQLWSPFYPPFGDADGGWSEGPSYWSWIARVCARTYRLVERATGIPVHKRSHLRNQVYYKLYGNPPWFKMSPFGDGQEGPARGGAAMLMLASLYDNPYAKWYGERLKTRLTGMDALLFPLKHVKANPPLDLPQGRCFSDVGLACSHTNLADGDMDVVFLLRSSPFGGCSHSYADQNTFVLDAYGEPLVIASGYYQLYGCPHHTKWTWQTIASNSILVDGQGQKRAWDAKGRIAEFASTVGADYIVGDARAAYTGRLERYDRRVLFLRPMHTGGAPLVVVRDDIEAAKPATITFLLHALTRMEVAPQTRTVRIRNGAAACRVDFLEPAQLDFRQTDKFTVPPQRPAPNQWHLSAVTSGKRKNTHSLIALQPSRRENEQRRPRPVVETGKGAVAAVFVLEAMDTATGERKSKNRTAGTRGGRRVIALFRTDPTAETVEVCGLRTDGRAASVTFIGDRVRSVAIFGGTFVAAGGGKDFLRLARRADVSVVRAGDGLWVECAAGNAPVAATVRAPFTAARAVEEDGTSVRIEPGTDGFVRLDLPPGRMVRIESGKARTNLDSAPPLYVPLAAPAAFIRTDYPRVEQVGYRARFPGTSGIWRVGVRVAGAGGGRGTVLLRAGTATAVADLAAGEERTLVLPACSLDFRTPVTVTRAAAGGTLEVVSAFARRVRGVNLLSNPSFEEVADGAPEGWRASTITGNAECRIEIAPGGASGRRCIKVICTAATGGDFGAVLRWPGVRPAPYDRRFRLSCRVRTDPDAVAGIQVTSRDWVFCQTTRKIGSPDKWTETAREFILPAGEDLTNVRLHMSTKRTGAVLYADEARLTELPAPPPANPSQIPLCMIGDSITWWGEGDWWRKYLVERLPRLAFVGTHSAKFGYNHAGEGGNGTRQVLARLDAIPACPYYHLLIGTNDNNVRKAADVAARAAATADRVRRIVLGLLKKPGCEKVFLGSVLPCDTDNPLRDKTNAATNRLLRDMMRTGALPGGRVVWVEYEKPIRALPDWRPEIRLHPTPDGYRLLADILAKKLVDSLRLERPETRPTFAVGAGVRVDNLWTGGPGGASRIPLIAGWYTLSFRVTETSGVKPTVELHGTGERLKQPLRVVFAVPAGAAGKRVSYEFCTGAEGYGYSRSRVGMTCRGVELRDILLEKKRPGGRASAYGTSTYIDTRTPPQPGEPVQFP